MTSTPEDYIPNQPPGSNRFNPTAILPVVGAVVAAAMLVVLAGWIFGIKQLTGTFWLLDGRMMPNAALAFLALGIAWLVVAGGGPNRVLVARGFAFVPLLIGLLTVLEHLLEIDLGIDELVFPESTLFPGVDTPGRMAPELALCILLLGCAFQLIVSPRKRVAHTMLSAGCSIVVVAIAIESLLLLAAPRWVEGWLMSGIRMSDISAIIVGITGVTCFVLEWRTRAHSWSIDLLNSAALAIVAVMLSAAGMKLASMAGESVVAGRTNSRLHAAHEELLKLRYDVAMARKEVVSFVHSKSTSTAGAFEAIAGRIETSRHWLFLRAKEEPQVRKAVAGIPELSDQVVEWFRQTMELATEGAPRQSFSGIIAGESRMLDEFTRETEKAMETLAGRIKELTLEIDLQAVHKRRVLFGGTAGSLLLILFAILRLNRAEIARRRSDDGLARAQAVAEIGHWRMDMVGTDSEVSAETRRIFGVPEGVPMTHELFLSRIHPDDIDWVEAEWQQALKGTVYDVEYRIIVDGGIRWVHELGEVVREPSGAPVCGVGIVRDVTSEREDAQALHRMAMVIRETPDMFIVCDVELNVTGVNRSVAKHFGSDLEAAPGALDLKAVFTEPAIERLRSDSLPSAERNGTWSGRSAVRGLEGAEIPVSMLVIAHKGRSGMVDEFSFVICDISAEVAAQEADRALREEQRARANLLSSLPGMSYRCRNDKDWTFEFVSPGCVALTGYSEDELVGAEVVKFGNLINSDDRRLVHEVVQEAVAARRPFELVYRITARDGREKWLLENGRGVFADDGRLLALEGFIADITERKLAEVRTAASERKFAALFQSSPVAMSITRLSDGKLTGVNAGFERLSGRKAGDVIGRTV
jgi:PAS domain S-box-containing protein